MENVVRVLSTLALKGAVSSLAGRYQAESGVRIDADFAPTLALLDRLRGGEGADVVILTKEALDDLAAEGSGGRGQLRRSGALLCRHRGEGRRRSSRHRNRTRAARDAARRAFGGLFAHRRQRHFVRATDRANGIASEINARARIIPSGFTAERLVTGEADLAVQQISELKQVAGVEVVGPIPHHLQTPAVFSAGRLAASKRVVQSDALLKYLASPEVAPVLRESGLEP